jgi:hypothetical protein
MPIKKNIGDVFEDKTMRKIFILIMVLLLSLTSIYAQDSIGNFTADVFLRSSAIPNEDSPDEGYLIFSVGLGVGYYFNIIPSIISPGVYCSWALDPLGFLTNTNRESIGMELDFRIFNLFRIGYFDIEPFYGAIGAFNHPIGEGFLQTAGCILTFKNMGIEYTHCFSFPNSSLKSFDRFAIVFHAY